MLLLSGRRRSPCGHTELLSHRHRVLRMEETARIQDLYRKAGIDLDSSVCFKC